MEEDMQKFAKEWIYELMNNMSLMQTSYQERHENDRWEKSVQYAIELRGWRECYRKVSQLCHHIGGEALDLFNEMFPDKVDSYKTVKH